MAVQKQSTKNNMVRSETSRVAVRPEPLLRGLVARGVAVALTALLFTLLVGEPIMVVLKPSEGVVELMAEAVDYYEKV